MECDGARIVLAFGNDALCPAPRKRKECTKLILNHTKLQCSAFDSANIVMDVLVLLLAKSGHIQHRLSEMFNPHGSRYTLS